MNTCTHGMRCQANRTNVADARPAAIDSNPHLGFRESDDEAEIAIANRVANDILHRSLDRWDRSARCSDVEDLWQIWCADAESYLRARAQAAELAFHAQLCTGRGRVKFQHKEVAPRQKASCEEAETMRARHLGKLARRIEDLVRQLHSGRNEACGNARVGTYCKPDTG